MEPLPKKVIAWVAAGIAAATVIVVIMLLWWAGASSLGGEKLVTAQFDALRTGLSIGLGGGGLFALYLAWRRQRSTEIGLAQKQQDQAAVALAYALQERTALASEADAGNRRITDLYTKAVEQIGSDKAPVRLGGLYALERLGQDTDSQRETIMNVVCAYLRMPFSATSPSPGESAPEDERERHAELVRAHAEEHQVRLTALRILHRHRSLNRGSNRVFWLYVTIDLTGASLTGAHLATADLALAALTGADLTDADLASADLTDACLAGADLTNADLTHARLAGADLTNVDLTHARIGGADLAGANLAGARLAGADLMDARLATADLTNVDLTGANLAGANLAGVDLAGADLTNAYVALADLTGANLIDVRGLKKEWTR